MSAAKVNNNKGPWGRAWIILMYFTFLFGAVEQYDFLHRKMAQT